MEAQQDEILILSQFYWPEEIGSAPYVTDLAEWLAERGHRVTVVTTRPHYPAYRVAPGFERGRQDDARVRGVRVRRLPAWTGLGTGASARIVLECSLFAQLLWRIAVGALPRRSRVISLCPSVLMVLGGALARRKGGTMVALVHDIQSGLASGLGMVGRGVLLRAMRGVERLALRRADVVLPLSEGMRRELVRLGVDGRVELLPIWVDPRKVFPLPAPPADPPTVAYMGNLGRKQDLMQILDCAALLLIRRPEVRVVIRGAGQQAKLLRDEAARRGLANVRFEALVSHERLNESLAAAHVHLVPQAPSGANFAVPSKAYSVMAAGRPFVATAAPGTPLWELQRETEAFVCVPPREAEALASALLRLIDAPDLRARMGARGRQWIERNAARDLVLERLAGLLRA